MHQLAVSLGLESADDLAKERFKVDRKKLEAMLHCKCFCKKYTCTYNKLINIILNAYSN